MFNIGATMGVLGGAIVSPSSNLTTPVKKLVIEKLCEKITFFLFYVV
jgi:hypothetical protein